MEKKAIIIGASSGIGRELAKVLSREGYILGLAARRKELLISLQEEIQGKNFVKKIDVSNTSVAMKELDSLIEEMGGVDLAIISSATGFINPELDWAKEKETIDVNVLGFCAMTNIFVTHFMKRGSGHLVGISSIAALRGSGSYSASKAFVSSYLEGLRHKFFKQAKNVLITDIKPGFVDTKMAKADHIFWMITPEKAAEMIYKAIYKKKTHAYISPRWRLIAWILKWMPGPLYDRFF